MQNGGNATPKLSINYLIAADPSGDTPGDWVLAEKNGTAAVKTDIEIGVELSKKTVDSKGWGKFYDGEANGIEVKETGGKTSYLYRSAAKPDGTAFTPSSKVKRVKANVSTKAPKYSVKKDAIKYKKNTYLIKDDEPAEYRATKGEVSEPGVYTLWFGATVKKPASVKQSLTIAAVGT